MSDSMVGKIYKNKVFKDIVEITEEFTTRCEVKIISSGPDGEAYSFYKGGFNKSRFLDPNEYEDVSYMKSDLWKAINKE